MARTQILGTMVGPRLDYQPLFGKMSPHSSPPRGGSKTGPGRRRKSSLGGAQNKDFGVALQTVLCHSFADSILVWFLE